MTTSGQQDLFAGEATDDPMVESKDSKEAQKGSSQKPTVNAETMAKKQREISVSEFFTKNRHLLGFDSPRKALLTAVKEAVDNSLDACEEARILPDLKVTIERIGTNEKQFTMIVEDNGPGIVKAQVPHVFGRLCRLRCQLRFRQVLPASQRRAWCVGHRCSRAAIVVPDPGPNRPKHPIPIKPASAACSHRFDLDHHHPHHHSTSTSLD